MALPGAAPLLDLASLPGRLPRLGGRSGKTNLNFNARQSVDKTAAAGIGLVVAARTGQAARPDAHFPGGQPSIEFMMLTVISHNDTGIQNGGLCMKGRIYQNKGGYVVRFGRDLSRWYKEKAEAERFLTGVRYEVDKGTFDPRDYNPDRPLAFINLAEQYIDFKKKTLKPRSYSNIKRYIDRAINAWGYRTIKSINYAEIEDFLYAQKVSDKTRANMKSCLHDFFSWLKRRRIITLQQFPEFPAIKYELGWRNIVDISTQQAIINEVYRISHGVNPKIWLGVKWLATYISVRPGELLNLKEGDINRAEGFFVIPHPKEKDPKIIYLLDDDIKLLNMMPKGLPGLYFFRHGKGNGAAKPGAQFGKDYLYKWWKQACKNLRVEKVDLYGGTRHSTVTALGKELTPEQIRAGSLHKTNKAFERYFQSKQIDAKIVYQKAANLQQTYNRDGDAKGGKVLKLK